MSSRMTERREAIAKFVTERGTVTFAQLKKTFPDISEMTIRTDLRPLDEARRIVRTHGRARSVEYVVGTDNLLLNRSARNVEEKNIIAGKAKEIEDKRLLAFTNSLTCAAELSNLENVHTIVIGGKLNRYSMSLNGSKSIEEIGLLNFDMLFLGLTSFQSSMGFGCGSDDEAALKRALISHAERTAVLMDSSKLGQRSTFKICGLEDVDYVVSDGKLSEHFKKYCEEADVTIL